MLTDNLHEIKNKIKIMQNELELLSKTYKSMKDCKGLVLVDGLNPLLSKIGFKMLYKKDKSPKVIEVEVFVSAQCGYRCEDIVEYRQEYVNYILDGFSEDELDKLFTEPQIDIQSYEIDLDNDSFETSIGTFDGKIKENLKYNVMYKEDLIPAENMELFNKLKNFTEV